MLFYDILCFYQRSIKNYVNLYFNNNSLTQKINVDKQQKRTRNGVPFFELPQQYRTISNETVIFPLSPVWTL